MSILVPTQDLAPSLTSRVVTLKVADMLEGPLPAGKKHSMTFTLPGDVRVPADGIFVQAGATTVELENGTGEIRLPTIDADAVADGLGSDWYILVSRSWSPQVDMYRIPSGTTPIALASITPVQEVTLEMGQWLLTNASVELVEGPQWGVTVVVTGGIARFRFTVPPAAVAFYKGTVGASVDLDTLTIPGLYGYLPTSTNKPTANSGSVFVSDVNGALQQFAIEYALNGPQLHARIRGSQGWSTWERVDGRLREPIMATSGMDPNTFDDNTVVAVNALANMPNLPPGAPTAGKLTTTVLIPTGTRPKVQEYLSTGTAPQFWTRFSGSTGWSAWRRLDSGAIDLSGLGGASVSPAALKTVPLALTVGGSSSAWGSTAGGMRLPVRFARAIQRWRVHVRNINPREGAAQAATVTLPEVRFGPRGAQPHQLASSTLLASNLSGSGDLVTPWQTSAIEADVDYLLAIGWSASAATRQVVGGGWTVAAAADAANSAATATATANMPLDVWIEAEVAPGTRVVAGFGDSLTSGVGAAQPVYDSWLSQWCRANGCLPVHYAASGDTMEGWSDQTHYKWQRWLGLSRPDAVVHAMGSNDVFGGATLATLRTRRAASMELLRKLVAPIVVSATILPRTGDTSPQEQVRRDYNAWLRSLADDARDVFDFVPAVSSNDETLMPAFDADGTHLNAAGYGALAGTIVRPLAAPDVAAGGVQDTGRRNILTLWDGGAGGGVVQLRRVGNLVHLNVYGNVMTGAAAVLTLPLGFRPDYRRLWNAPTYPGGAGNRIIATEAGAVTQFGVASGNAAAQYIALSWPTSDPWPSTLPGTAA